MRCCNNSQRTTNIWPTEGTKDDKITLTHNRLVGPRQSQFRASEIRFRWNISCAFRLRSHLVNKVNIERGGDRTHTLTHWNRALCSLHDYCRRPLNDHSTQFISIIHNQDSQCGCGLWVTVFNCFKFISRKFSFASPQQQHQHRARECVCTFAVDC